MLFCTYVFNKHTKFFIIPEQMESVLYRYQILLGDEIKKIEIIKHISIKTYFA